MIQKIVSGGQTGADQGALDAAIRLGLDHGGWVPKGRKTEDGVLPDKYQVREMTDGDYNDRTERNVVDSDGTLIISHSRLTGGSEFTRKMALKHGRPWIHIDLETTTMFMAARQVSDWVLEHRVIVLNVAGPRASKDPAIYQATMDILEAVYYLDTIADSRAAAAAADPEPAPSSIEDAVDRLLERLPLRDRSIIANLAQDQLDDIKRALEVFLYHSFGLNGDNAALIQACADDPSNDDDPAQVIVSALWRRLVDTHRLRILDPRQS